MKYLFVMFLALLLSSCAKQNSLEITPITSGNVIFTFAHNINGESLKFDTLRYRTSTGNLYEVNDLQYFVSRVSIHSAKGKWQNITTDDGIHYIDARDNNSATWWTNDKIPVDTYDSVAFIFGLDQIQNTTGRFPDPPQRDMFWPDMMGGGYHYMKMNLKWENDTMAHAESFMFHIGIGQVYAGHTINPDSIIGFVQNYFRVSLPCSFNITSGGYRQVMLQMNIERWFDGQNAFNFAAWPNGIMQEQEGMFRACQNGRNAFSVSVAK
jgi:hypothetical protein